jgi:hypothetical protein
MTGEKPYYLDMSGGNFGDCLLSSFAFLRESWKTEWIGLPQVLSKCVQFLKISNAIHDDSTRVLLETALVIARNIEEEEALRTGKPEPAYHNRLHFSDTLTTITLQCALETQHGALVDSAWHAALLLIAVSHDFHHPGRVNLYQSDIESLTVNALTPFMKSNGISPLWTERIRTIILRSDFALVKENHARVQGRKFSWDTDWATVLLNEADIMASASSDFGPSLSLSLAREWEVILHPAYTSIATDDGRRQFLSNIQLSSYSAMVLGNAVIISSLDHHTSKNPSLN